MRCALRRRAVDPQNFSVNRSDVRQIESIWDGGILHGNYFSRQENFSCFTYTNSLKFVAAKLPFNLLRFILFAAVIRNLLNLPRRDVIHGDSCDGKLLEQTSHDSHAHNDSIYSGRRRRILSFPRVRPFRRFLLLMQTLNWLSLTLWAIFICFHAISLLAANSSSFWRRAPALNTELPFHIMAISATWSMKGKQAERGGAEKKKKYCDASHVTIHRNVVLSFACSLIFFSYSFSLGVNQVGEEREK